MGDKKQLKLIKEGSTIWNKWRNKNKWAQIDFSGENLKGVDLADYNFMLANFKGSNLSKANLTNANFSNAELTGINLRGATLNGANFTEASIDHSILVKAICIETDFSYCHLGYAKFTHADCSKAKFIGAKCYKTNLIGANFTEAFFTAADIQFCNLSKANLSGAYLSTARIIQTIVTGSIFTNCSAYGLAAWDLIGIPKDQTNITITPPWSTEVTVDNLQVSQFIYLLLKNENIRGIIDTITSKAVLILGRFTEERKEVLDAIREELRKHNFTPILFDFDKPTSKDVLGTVETLSRMVRFIIADLTDPSSIPLELGTVVPYLSTTPVLPIKLKGSAVSFTMFDDLRRRYRDWVLDTYEYEDGLSLIANLPHVIAPANERAKELRSRI